MRTIYTNSLIDKDTEACLWDSAIFVIDTCALPDFYYMTKENQKINADILKSDFLYRVFICCVSGKWV